MTNKPPTEQQLDETDVDVVADRAAQVIASMGADIRALTAERNRYRNAWHNARARAVDGRSDAELAETRAGTPVRVETLARLLCDADDTLTDGPSWDHISQTPGLGRDEYRNVARYLLRKVTVTQSGSGPVECGDEIPGMTCTLPDGPHDDWLHRDERGHWWSQMRIPPYSNRERLAADAARAAAVPAEAGE